MKRKTGAGQEFFDFGSDEPVAPPVVVARAPGKREQHLEQIKRDMAVLAGPEHFYTGDEEFYRRRIEMHREAIKALDAGAQSPASS